MIPSSISATALRKGKKSSVTSTLKNCNSVALLGDLLLCPSTLLHLSNFRLIFLHFKSLVHRVVFFTGLRDLCRPNILPTKR